ncbi:MAG: hypothetical protein U9N87_01875 [Planctomycetota bacterium]|nr:hypothetical protein [Planctomycetota bacterium]
MHTPFGSWRKPLGEKKQRSEEKRAEVKRPERIRMRGPRGAHREVIKRPMSAREQRRENLLAVAKEVWPNVQVIAKSTGKRGRPPHRKLLIEALGKKNLPITISEAKRLMRELSKA